MRERSPSLLTLLTLRSALIIDDPRLWMKRFKPLSLHLYFVDGFRYDNKSSPFPPSMQEEDEPSETDEDEEATFSDIAFLHDTSSSEVYQDTEEEEALFTSSSSE